MSKNAYRPTLGLGIEDAPIDEAAAEALRLGHKLAGQFAANGSDTLDASILLQRLGEAVLAWRPVVAAARAMLAAEAEAAYHQANNRPGSAAKARHQTRLATLVAVRALDGDA